MAYTEDKAKSQSWTRSRWSLALLTCATIGGAVLIRSLMPTATVEAQTPRARERTAAQQRSATPQNRRAPAKAAANKTGGKNVAAVVNSEPITRDELGRLCLVRWGEETLEGLVNKQLITEACHARGILISDRDIDSEVQSIASKFNMSVEQYIKMLKTERDVSETEYRKDIVWPTIALKRLAADQLTVSNADLEKEFEAEFGEKVQVRMISMTSRKKAVEVLKLAKAQPEEFSRLAKQHSEDPNSASAKGLIPPVRRHIGDPAVEKAVFALKEGEISDIVEAANQFFIFLCERRLQPATISPQYRQQVTTRLRDRIVERNLRTASASIFEDLQKKASIVNVLNDPRKRQQSPGVAAVVNNQQITIEQLVDECLLRYGRDMLESEITYRLLRQELKKQKLEVKQNEINEEIGRAALSFGYIKPDGSADLEAWVKVVTEKESVGVKEYIRDAVWPSVALKQLVGENVSVSEEDIAKGFEANYGERVEVLAIVLGNQRTAQEVWDMARNRLDSDKKPSREFFGQLAEQYSIEPISRANFGEIPPISRYGGQPQIEKEAFRLEPGELSGIVAMGDKYIILRCTGRTEPLVKQAADVKDELVADIREKKLRVAMAAEYDRLRDVAQIDNFLAGTSQTGRGNIRLPEKIPVRSVSGPGKAPVRR